LAIVRSLANGVDPESGEVFAPDSAYQRPQVVRTLYEAAAALERIERFERRRSQMPQKTGEPWSEEEDCKLLAAFDAGRALHERARSLARKYGAARIRQDLKAKGVDREIIEAVSTGDELERARAILSRKYRGPADSRQELARRARFLQGRGFSMAVIGRLLRSSDDLL